MRGYGTPLSLVFYMKLEYSLNLLPSPYGSGPAILDEEEWRQGAQFQVQEADKDILVRAAQRTLETRRPLAKIKNIATRRNQAAKKIVALLEER